MTQELGLEGVAPGRSPLCVRTVLSSMENHRIHGRVRSEEVPLGSCLLRLPYRENLHGWTVRLTLVRSPLWWAASVYLPDIYSEKRSSVRGHDRIKESSLILITSGGHFNIFFINFLRIPYIESVYLGHIDLLLQPLGLPISTLSHALPDPPLKPLPFQTLFSFFLLYDPLSLICAVHMYSVAGPSTEIGGFIRGHILKEN